MIFKKMITLYYHDRKVKTIDAILLDQLIVCFLGAKLLTDDIITARFAKNSHYQSHQTSMASTKSSKSNERDHKKKKKKKNILGIGTSSPLTTSSNLTLSPGRLSIDDNYEIKRPNRTNKSKRTRVK
jgi:hypothetical protein